ncbi:jacalin domain protein, putative [Rhizoctonia solani AG-3 Rhs1AP]|uniref:Jacalin domain protein, putative n=1 Tax=Rhizoctonia solani AG-3 Rhs1AP TaxID=1086054 RepID=X8IYY5_9AGAM|nr:jacalin domain protein, putative [Rhizoctonia solani AG-3 Rhs1AP]
MSTPQVAHVGGTGDDNVLLPAENNLDSNGCILRQNGWLCGFRVDNMDGPQNLTRQVASYVDGAAPLTVETNDILTEVITAHNKRESNYVHHGWSAGAITTISPWTSSRIYMTDRQSPDGKWITRRILAQRLRVRVFLEDLAPVPEFEAAIKEALSRSTRFEKFQEVYRCLKRWLVKPNYK